MPTSAERPLTVYLIAGEASGDLLGAELMRALAAQTGGNIRFHGIGGDKMEAQGLKSLFPSRELSLMGFAEILPHMFKLMARIEHAVDDIFAKAPDVVITIDSPGFNFRVAEKLRKRGVRAKLVHYVAPTVWAYKPERAKRCAELFDHLLCILPFEPPYFTREGLACTYIGHQAVYAPFTGDAANFRARYDLPENARIITMLPGSRRNEIKRHMPPFARAISALALSEPHIATVLAVPVSPHLLPSIMPYFNECPFRAVLIADEQDKKDALAASHFALVKSGTVTLEVAHANAPMIVAYRAHPLTARMVRKMVKVRHVTLINILQGREAVPEFLQELCTPNFLASAASSLLHSPERRQRQQAEMREALAQLAPPSPQAPAETAAKIVLSLLFPSAERK